MWFFQQNKVLMGWMIFFRNEAAHFFINCRVPGIFSQENGSFSFSWYISLNFIYSAPIKKTKANICDIQTLKAIAYLVQSATSCPANRWITVHVRIFSTVTLLGVIMYCNSLSSCRMLFEWT